MALPCEIEVFKAVGSGENLVQIGEDVAAGAEVLPAGQLLRPQDLGGLLALGITAVSVRPRPRVAILATGDEVIPPDKETGPGQIRDINSYTVAGQVLRAGGEPLILGIIPINWRCWKRPQMKRLRRLICSSCRPALRSVCAT